MHPQLKKDLAENNISHAYLLYGTPEETYENALEFALTLNCLAPKNGKACGECRNCLLGKMESFCDFAVLRPEKANYTVKQIRELLKIVQFSAQEGRYRIFMLVDIDKLNEVSANTLLKTLEEPVKNTVFLLLSSNSDKTLATIESRCRIIRQDTTNTEISDACLDEAYNLLTTLPQQSLEYIFNLCQNYSKDKNKAKGQANLKNIVEAMAEILSRNYENHYCPSGESAYLLNNQQFGDDILLELWQKTGDALKYLEYQVTTPLIAEDLFLAVKEKVGLKKELQD